MKTDRSDHLERKGPSQLHKHRPVASRSYEFCWVPFPTPSYRCRWTQAIHRNFVTQNPHHVYASDIEITGTFTLLSQEGNLCGQGREDPSTVLTLGCWGKWGVWETITHSSWHMQPGANAGKLCGHHMHPLQHLLWYVLINITQIMDTTFRDYCYDNIHDTILKWSPYIFGGWKSYIYWHSRMRPIGWCWSPLNIYVTCITFFCKFTRWTLRNDCSPQWFRQQTKQ